jgi:hypothetical protein
LKEETPIKPKSPKWELLVGENAALSELFPGGQVNHVIGEGAKKLTLIRTPKLFRRITV